MGTAKLGIRWDGSCLALSMQNKSGLQFASLALFQMFGWEWCCAAFAMQHDYRSKLGILAVIDFQLNNFEF